MILVTGATGQLGRLVVEGLLEKVPAGQVAVAVRSPDKASAWAARGVQVRQADYGQPESLAAAFQGVDKVLLISSSEVGQRVAQHRAVVEAARRAGVRLIAYTSILRADTSPLALAAEHKATEGLIRDSGVPFVFLRNGWYIENYTVGLAPALAHGALVGSAGEGRIAAATRADYAAAAIQVLTTPGHENTVYELGGDSPFSLSEFAAEVARQTGKPLVYQDLPAEQYERVLVGAGVPEGFARILVDSSVQSSRDALNDGSHTLSHLIGRPTTPLAAALGATLER
ncbi:SDR family oxidoreductase [Archangium primigenium]|uniref:SDR family oxidoreductase n=1 Tax=[Archangium] primigenium TaxID=2792470 RepID=UPI00195845BF|nr:SDR family oxidoreductase [Archangium primigenium]MBM7112626.1 SDR family oxidoreductase [Archangium primigenium]